MTVFLFVTVLLFTFLLLEKADWKLFPLNINAKAKQKPAIIRNIVKFLIFDLVSMRVVFVGYRENRCGEFFLESGHNEIICVPCCFEVPIHLLNVGLFC